MSLEEFCALERSAPPDCVVCRLPEVDQINEQACKHSGKSGASRPNISELSYRWLESMGRAEGIALADIRRHLGGGHHRR